MKKAIVFVFLLIIIASLSNIEKFSGSGTNKLERYIIFLKWDVPNEKIDEIKRNYQLYIMKAKTFSQKEIRLDAMRKEIHNFLERHFKPKFEYLMKYIRDLGGKPIKYIVSGPAVVAYLNEEMVEMIKELPIVDRIIKDFKIKINLDVAVPTLLPDEWYAHGYDGSNDIGDNIKGIEVAICDTGIYKNHPALTGKVIDERDFSDDGTPDDLNGHGTMVAGIVASSDSTYKGIAYGVNLINAKCMNKDGEGDFSWLMDAVDWAVGSATDTAEIINTSLGSDEYTPDGENELTKYLDKIVNLYHVVWVTAAGNVNTKTGYNKVNIPGDNYNGITVGAVDDQGTTDRSDDTYASFSCIGPTEDGRIKPDLVAPGASITSTYINGGFYTLPGTSFATPLVAGAAALIAPYMIEKFGEQWYLGVKALLINSADDIDELGPDNRTGWGEVNLQKAWEYHNNTYIIKLSTDEIATYSTYLTGGDSLEVTIVWDRVYKGETLLGNVLFYDLTKFKIEVYDPDGNLVAEKSDSNNVLKINYTAVKPGVYMILIKVVDIDPELVIDKGGDFVAINSNIPLISGALNVNTTLETNINATTIQDSEIVNIRINVKNVGNETIQDASIRVLSAKMIDVANISEYNVGDLEPNEEYSVEVNLRAYYLGQDIIKILLYARVKGIKVLINSSQYTVNILDDDDSPPTVTIESISGSGIAFTNIQIKVKATDPSGIKSIVLLYAVGRPVSLNSYDKILIANFTGEETAIATFNVRVELLWIGETIYFAAYAIDADSDRPNDTETSSLTVNKLYSIPLELNLAVFIGPIIILAVVLIIIKRKPKKKVRSRRVLRGDVVYI